MAPQIRPCSNKPFKKRKKDKKLDGDLVVNIGRKGQVAV